MLGYYFQSWIQYSVEDIHVVMLYYLLLYFIWHKFPPLYSTSSMGLMPPQKRTVFMISK